MTSQGPSLHEPASRRDLIRSWSCGSWPWAHLVRFAGTGLLNSAFGYTVFVLLLKTGMAVPAALVGSTLSGILFNFQTSRRLVFQSRRTGLLLRFAVVYVVLFGMNYTAIVALKACGLAPWAAQAVLVIPMALTAFVAQRNLVFQQDRPVS